MGEQQDIPRASRRAPIVEMLAIALPSVATMMSYTLMQFIDAKMVAHIDPPNPAYIAAQGNGGIAAWLGISVMFGTLMIVNTFVSQNLGAGRGERGSVYAWTAIWLSLAWAIVLIPYGLAMPAIFGSMGHPEDVLALEIQYGQILIFGSFFTVATRGLSNYFYGMHRAGVVLVAALAGNLCNVLANIPLIFGSAGMPRTGLAPLDALGDLGRQISLAIGLDGLGVPGAAWGTLLGSSVELAIPMIIFLGPMHRTFRTRSAWRPERRAMLDVLRVGWPGGVMMLNEIFCWAVLFSTLIPYAGKVAMAQRTGLPLDAEPVDSAGRTANAAAWVALRYMHMSFMPTVGLSIAVTALVGKCMGMGRPDLAARRAWLGLAIGVGYMSLAALLFVVARRPMIAFFVPQGLSDEEVARFLEIGGAFMIAAAVFQLFDAIAIILSGALRGAGDTVWPGVVTVVLSWVVIVGLGSLLIVVAPSWGALGPWIAASLYIVLLGLAMLARFLFGPWRRIALVRVEEGEESS